MRRISRKVMVGGLAVGGGAPVSVQSMLNAPSHDIAANVAQAKALEAAGCQIIRAAVPDLEAVRIIPTLKEAVGVPIVADIHFDYRIVVEAAVAGVDKIRINPGNIGDDDRVKTAVDACRSRGIPIRIGVNSGSVEKGILAKYGGATAEALCESALGHAKILERFDFFDTILSMKSSDVTTTIAAYRLAAERCDYPLHLGVTEAGTERMGLVKSAIGLGSLLADGIGDTVRVSLTADPVREIAAGIDILKAVGLRGGVNIISCPTCGRTQIDIISIARKVEEAVAGLEKDIKIAVMGCVVNGPGEAGDADIGISGGNGCAVIFRHGEVLRKVDEDDIIPELLKEIAEL